MWLKHLIMAKTKTNHEHSVTFLETSLFPASCCLQPSKDQNLKEQPYNPYTFISLLNMCVDSFSSSLPIWPWRPWLLLSLWDWNGISFLFCSLHVVSLVHLHHLSSSQSLALHLFSISVSHSEYFCLLSGSAASQHAPHRLCLSAALSGFSNIQCPINTKKASD